MNNLSCQLIQLPTHCEVVKISELLRALENAGEIGITIALHSAKESTLTKTKPCCFVLDAPKEKTLQKKASFTQRGSGCKNLTMLQCT